MFLSRKTPLPPLTNTSILQSTRWYVAGCQAQLIARCGRRRVVQHHAQTLHGRLARASSVGVLFYFPPLVIDANNSAVVYRDPFIVLVLSLSFIASIFFLHISAKIIRAFTK